MSKLLFGVNLSTSAARGSDPVGLALRAEALGFDFVSASDHPCGDHPTNETWTMLTWVAAATSTIGLTTRVLGVPFRNPALLAKMAETLQRLSGGRLVLGLGGGGNDGEIAAMGLPVLNPGDKITALGEAIEALRRLWAGPHASYEGHFHAVRDATVTPRPARPVPIWLGTFGPRGLDLAGRTADGWIPTLGYAPADQLGPMLRQVRRAAEQAGRAPDAIRCILNLSVDAVRDPGALVAQLGDLADLGFDGFNFIVPEEGTADHWYRLADAVLPHVAS